MRKSIRKNKRRSKKGGMLKSLLSQGLTRRQIIKPIISLPIQVNFKEPIIQQFDAFFPKGKIIDFDNYFIIQEKILLQNKSPTNNQLLYNFIKDLLEKTKNFLDTKIRQQNKMENVNKVFEKIGSELLVILLDYPVDDIKKLFPILSIILPTKNEKPLMGGSSMIPTSSSMIPSIAPLSSGHIHTFTQTDFIVCLVIGLVCYLLINIAYRYDCWSMYCCEQDCLGSECRPCFYCCCVPILFMFALPTLIEKWICEKLEFFKENIEEIRRRRRRNNAAQRRNDAVQPQDMELRTLGEVLNHNRLQVIVTKMKCNQETMEKDIDNIKKVFPFFNEEIIFFFSKIDEILRNDNSTDYRDYVEAHKFHWKPLMNQIENVIQCHKQNILVLDEEREKEYDEFLQKYNTVSCNSCYDKPIAAFNRIPFDCKTQSCCQLCSECWNEINKIKIDEKTGKVIVRRCAYCREQNEKKEKKEKKEEENEEEKDEEENEEKKEEEETATNPTIFERLGLGLYGLLKSRPETSTQYDQLSPANNLEIGKKYYYMKHGKLKTGTLREIINNPLYSNQTDMYLFDGDTTEPISKHVIFSIPEETTSNPSSSNTRPATSLSSNTRPATSLSSNTRPATSLSSNTRPATSSAPRENLIKAERYIIGKKYYYYKQGYGIVSGILNEVKIYTNENNKYKFINDPNYVPSSLIFYRYDNKESNYNYYNSPVIRGEEDI
jgi:hypothetical protein